jgi:hypothetical protein
VSRYLALFPPVKLVLVQNEGRAWLALQASRGDTRFTIRGLVPVQLCEEGLGRFETILSRFDGTMFWYEKKDPGRSPAFAAYLNEQLAHESEAGLPPAPELLHKAGLTREERDAYELVRALKVEARRSRAEVRLADALAHAGAWLRSFVERDDVYVVTYEVDGQRHASTIHRGDLTVVTAGVCLAGQDQRFDLTSLVGVLREGHQVGHVVWVGQDGMDEQEYRRIYPPDDEHAPEGGEP